MICSANTSLTLPFTAGAMDPLPSIALAPILSEAPRLEHLFEQASNALGFALNQTHSYKEIEERLLTNLMACDANPRYQRASLELPSERGCCGNVGSDETIEEVRKLLSHSCQSRPTAGCEEKKWSSKDTFKRSLALGMEDLARIAERFRDHDAPTDKKDILAIGRELLDLQRKVSDSHYLFTHGMSRVHALLPKLITKLDHRLWPKRDSNGFIFARVVPPQKPMTQISEIFQQLERTDDEGLRYELLCVDGDLLNRDEIESALYFYLKNYNVFQSIHSIVCDILTRFAEEFGMDFSTTSEKNLDFDEKLLIKWNPTWGRKRGVLLAYAVPKTLITNPNTNFVYTSHPFGQFVDKKDPLARLEELVSGPVQDTGLSVRLLTSHLRPENGIKAFWVGEKKDQDQYVLAWAKKLSELAESFFSKILQHCQAEAAPDFSGAKNGECERLLRETAAETGKGGPL